jgi:hypothetical protein
MDKQLSPWLTYLWLWTSYLTFLKPDLLVLKGDNYNNTYPWATAHSVFKCRKERVKKRGACRWDWEGITQIAQLDGQSGTARRDLSPALTPCEGVLPHTHTPFLSYPTWTSLHSMALWTSVCSWGLPCYATSGPPTSCGRRWPASEHCRTGRGWKSVKTKAVKLSNGTFPEKVGEINRKLGWRGM